MKTREIKLAKPPSDSALLRALKESMGPIFSYFEDNLGDFSQPKVLDIRVTAAHGELKIEYGIGDPKSD